VPATHLPGAADCAGAATYNMGLSRRRGDAVSRGAWAPHERLAYHAFGELLPRVFSPDGFRAPPNRRVEVVIGRS